MFGGGVCRPLAAFLASHLARRGTRGPRLGKTENRLAFYFHARPLSQSAHRPPARIKCARGFWLIVPSGRAEPRSRAILNAHPCRSVRARRVHHTSVPNQAITSRDLVTYTLAQPECSAKLEFSEWIFAPSSWKQRDTFLLLRGSVWRFFAFWRLDLHPQAGGFKV